MESVLHSTILHILRPLVRTLHRYGLSFGEFNQIARRVYVEAAESALTESGEKATTSRIAVSTGLTRKEVAKLRQSEVIQVAPSESYNRGVRVVSGWIKDVDFHTLEGLPKALVLQGDESSFEGLVSRYSGDIPYRAMLKELQQSSVVQFNEQGLVELITNAYIPAANDTEKLSILGADVGLLIKTIDYNLQSNQANAHFQRKVSYDNLPFEAVEQFKQMVSQDGMTLLVKFNEWLAENDRDSNPSIQGNGKYSAGIGIYYFEETLESKTQILNKDDKHAS